MLKLTYKQLRNSLFFQGCGKLFRHTKYPDMRLVQHLGRLSDSLDKAFEESQKLFNKLLEEYAVLDDQKKPKFKVENGQEVPDIKPEVKDEYKQKYDEFLALDVEIPSKKLQLHELKDVGLSPVEFMAIEPLLNALENVK